MVASSDCRRRVQTAQGDPPVAMPPPHFQKPYDSRPLIESAINCFLNGVASSSRASKAGLPPDK
jgi:hypothetical protein